MVFPTLALLPLVLVEPPFL